MVSGCEKQVGVCLQLLCYQRLRPIVLIVQNIYIRETRKQKQTDRRVCACSLSFCFVGARQVICGLLIYADANQSSMRALNC